MKPVEGKKAGMGLMEFSRKRVTYKSDGSVARLTLSRPGGGSVLFPSDFQSLY